MKNIYFENKQIATRFKKNFNSDVDPILQRDSKYVKIFKLGKISSKNETIPELFSKN